MSRGAKKTHNGAVERAVDVHKIWAIVVKNWLVLRGDYVRLVPLTMFPIIMIVIFGYASGNLPKHIDAAVVDYDRTALSQQVQDDLSSMETFRLKYAVGTQDEARRMMDEGWIKVLFVIPQGFGKSVQDGKPAHIGIMVDESDSSVAGVSKSTATVFVQRLSAEITASRLKGITAKAEAARQDLKPAKEAQGQGGQAIDAMGAPVAYYWKDLSFVYSKSSGRIAASVQETRNSLGYLVDQNEVVAGYNPSSMGQAALTLLAVGDAQQATLQQMAFYQAIGGAQAKMFGDAGGIYSGYRALSSLYSAQEANAEAAAAAATAADSKLKDISDDAQRAPAPIGLDMLEPYGYGRRGIDFLLPSILALIIFQGATMGLGRAIAGERKDGSLTRVFLTPTSNATIILGTQAFYLIFETIRSSLIIVVAIALFGVSISGNLLDIVLIIGLFALGSTGVGMVLSVVTKNQEQYMALGMLISLPVMFLSGTFFPIQTMPPALQSFAAFLPVTYAADALRGVMVKGFSLYAVAPDLLALVAFGAFTLVLSLLMFKRELV